MVNVHLCVDSCFTARNSDKTTIGCYFCGKRFNSKCFELSAQQTLKLISSENNVIFLCHKCIDRVNKLKQNIRKSTETSERTSVTDSEVQRVNIHNSQSSVDDRTSTTDVLSILRKMEKRFSEIQDSNSEIKIMLGSSTHPNVINDTRGVEPTITSIQQSITNLHAKLDHNTNERTANEGKTHSLILDKLSELNDRVCTQLNQGTKFPVKVSGSSTSKNHLNRAVMTTDPLNWSFSFNQPVTANENCEIYQLLHGFEKNTWTSFDHLCCKLSENTDAILQIELMIKEWNSKFYKQRLTSPTMESITMDNLQSINDKCDIIKNMMESYGNGRRLQDDENSQDDDATQLMRNQFLKIIDDDSETHMPSIDNVRLNAQEKSNIMLSKDDSVEQDLIITPEIELINLNNSIDGVSNMSTEQRRHELFEKNANDNQKTLETVVKQVSDIREMLLCNNKKSKTKKPETYAHKMKVTENISVLTVTPKISQSSDATEGDLKRLIDPTKVRINKVKKLPNGCVAIECTDSNESEQVKKLLCEKMCDGYDVLTPELKKPRIKILDVADELSDVELINTLKTQNDFLDKGEMTVINFFRNRNKKYTAIVELDPTSFEQCMKTKKVKILWANCNLLEDLNVFRCFKCNGYNHKQANCTNDVTCKRCGEKHDFTHCTSETEKCVNCRTANEKYNLKLNVNHAVNSEKCSVYKKRIETERRKIKYSR